MARRGEATGWDSGTPMACSGSGGRSWQGHLVEWLTSVGITRASDMNARLVGIWMSHMRVVMCCGHRHFPQQDRYILQCPVYGLMGHAAL